MSPINKSRNQTAFTISIEARRGITTGISAKDRSRTIKTAINENVKKNEIISPGHIFPIIAKDGGVLVRAGHTEASVDISKLMAEPNTDFKRLESAIEKQIQKLSNKIDHIDWIVDRPKVQDKVELAKAELFKDKK